MPEPQILKDSERADWLSQYVLGASRLNLYIWRAEQMIQRKYREVRPAGADFDDYDLSGKPPHHDVALRGWAEDENGNPDPQAMDEDLLAALKDAITQIATHYVESPSPYTESMSQGDRSVSFREDADEVPSECFAPLRPFDEREAWF